MRNWFTELNNINVNEHVEKKNGLSYLSWMWAWQELKKRFPLSYCTVHEAPEGLLVWKDPVGCHVKTSVTLVWEEPDGLHEHTVTEYLPVMDMRNRSIPYDSADSMAVNKTVQRSLTKCIARLGLGAYIYAGEDLPEESDEDKQRIAKALTTIDMEVKRITKTMKAEEKIALANNVIIPTIGQANYKICREPAKLEALAEKLAGMAA